MNTTTRRCSMSAIDDSPWRCGSGDCMGRRPDCEARRRNIAEEEWLTRQSALNAYENAWREAYGLPLLTAARRDATDVVRRFNLQERVEVAG